MVVIACVDDLIVAGRADGVGKLKKHVNVTFPTEILANCHTTVLVRCQEIGSMVH